MTMKLPADWPAWDGEQRARCLLHLAYGAMPPGQVFVSGPEVNAMALGLSYPQMQQWVALVAPLLADAPAAPATPAPAAPVPWDGLEGLRQPQGAKRQPDATVEVVGPGLVVNGPALAVLEGLASLGFQVDCKAWCGLEQWAGTAEKNREHVQQHAPGMLVRVEVRPMPWGG